MSEGACVQDSYKTTTYATSDQLRYAFDRWGEG